MKKNIRLLMTAVLLTVAMAVWAQSNTTSISGKLWEPGGDNPLEYTYTGGRLTEEPRKDGTNRITYVGEIREGETFTITVNGLYNYNVFPNSKSKLWVEGRYSGGQEASPVVSKELIMNESASLTYTVTIPKNKNVKVFECWAHFESNSVQIYLHVVPVTTEVKPGTVKGSMERLGMIMNYSCSNVIVTKKSEPVVKDTLMNVSIFGLVKAGSKLSLSCKGETKDVIYKAKPAWRNSNLQKRQIPEQIIRVWALTEGSNGKPKEIKGYDPITQSITVPENVSAIRVDMEYRILCDWDPYYLVLRCQMRWDVVKKFSNITTTNPKYQDVAKDNVCPTCKGEFTGYFVKRDKGGYGTICCENGSTPQDMDRYFTPIYNNDRINSHSRVGSVIKRLGNPTTRISLLHGATALCKTKPYYITVPNTGYTTGGPTKWKVNGTHLYIKGGQVTVVEEDEHVDEVKRDLVVVHLDNCTAEPLGTAFVAKSDGNNSEAYLLSGALKITNTSGQSYTLKPGEASEVGKDGKIKVKKFDVNAVAQQYGINSLGTVNAAQTFTAGNLNYRILSNKTVELIGVKAASKSVVIPAQLKYNNMTYNVVGIAKNAFANQTQLTAISIPKTVKAIAEDAFLNTSLTQVTVSGDKVSIVKNAFRNCKKLTVATVNGKSPQCSPDAFNGCSAMKELRIKGINASNNGKKLNGTNAVIRVIK